MPRPSWWSMPPAYTAVDRAESEPDACARRQLPRPGRHRAGLRRARLPVHPPLDRLCLRRPQARRPTARTTRSAPTASMAGPSSRARRPCATRAPRTSSCARHGSTARSAPISSRPCCGSARERAGARHRRRPARLPHRRQGHRRGDRRHCLRSSRRARSDGYGTFHYCGAVPARGSSSRRPFSQPPPAWTIPSRACGPSRRPSIRPRRSARPTPCSIARKSLDVYNIETRPWQDRRGRLRRRAARR